ncbi:MAG: hypothetical protein M1418_10495, partial [Deltaproteobacteria bacterium]|nr:hypothetical protein [Deltaproteobacteria bacterium]
NRDGPENHRRSAATVHLSEVPMALEEKGADITTLFAGFRKSRSSREETGPSFFTTRDLPDVTGIRERSAGRSGMPPAPGADRPGR